MPAIGKEPGEAVRAFMMRWVELRDARRFTARRGDAIQRFCAAGCENNNSGLVPGAAPSLRRIANRLRRPTCDLYLLELALAEEADEAAVRRPEGVVRIARSRHRPG